MVGIDDTLDCYWLARLVRLVTKWGQVVAMFVRLIHRVPGVFQDIGGPGKVGCVHCAEGAKLVGRP
jgi:hypothetical protein